MKSVLENSEHNSTLAIACFERNYIELNNDKCHLLISRNKNEYLWAKLDQDIVWESNDVELTGVTIDNSLRFDKNVRNVFLKANRKLSALARVAKFVLFKKGAFSLKHL